MVKKRVIPCLDVAGGRVVKGVNFERLREMGQPVELARRYSELGADELVFLDITATLEGRGPILDVIGRAVDEAEQRAAVLERRGDVEEDELVGAELGVARRQLDGIADLAQRPEPDALDDAPCGDVEARDHTFLDHASALRSTCAPVGPLRSG